MDFETSHAIVALGLRLDQFEISITDDVGGVHRSGVSQFQVDMHQLKVDVRQLIIDVRELKVEVADLRKTIDENWQRTLMLFESVRDDIRMLAEGIALLSTKIDSLQR